MRNSIRYNIILPPLLFSSPPLPPSIEQPGNKEGPGKVEAERVKGRWAQKCTFARGGEGRKHVQNHYQPRRDGVALMGRRPFFQPLEIYPTPFFRRCIFHYTPPRTRGRHLPSRTFVAPSKHETRTTLPLCVTPLLTSC